MAGDFAGEGQNRRKTQVFLTKSHLPLPHDKEAGISRASTRRKRINTDDRAGSNTIGPFLCSAASEVTNPKTGGDNHPAR